MFKKLASLLLSLLLCLSVLPGQVLAADIPDPADPVDPPVIVEPVDPEDPDGSVMPMGGDASWPNDDDADHLV